MKLNLVSREIVPKNMSFAYVRMLNKLSYREASILCWRSTYELNHTYSANYVLNPVEYKNHLTDGYPSQGNVLSKKYFRKKNVKQMFTAHRK